MYFTEHYEFLSNFYPVDLEWNGLVWITVEHLFQAQKFLDPNSRAKIWAAPTPAKAKRLGRTLPGLRQDWEQVKDDVMLSILRQKFSDPVLRSKLLEVDGYIVEHNRWHDNYWGQCLCDKCVYRIGKNMLGKLLEKLREEFESTTEP